MAAAHSDYAGGLELKRATGGTTTRGDAPLLPRGGHGDPQFRDRVVCPAVVLNLGRQPAARGAEDRDHEFGSIRPGLRADLILLSKNPV